MILVIISRDKMRGRRAGYLEAVLLRRGRLVELYSTFVFDVFFPKTVSKCSVKNCFIPQIQIQSTGTIQICKRTSPLMLHGIRIHSFYLFSWPSARAIVANLNDSAMQPMHWQQCWMRPIMRGSESLQLQVPRDWKHKLNTGRFTDWQKDLRNTDCFKVIISHYWNYCEK